MGHYHHAELDGKQGLKILQNEYSWKEQTQWEGSPKSPEKNMPIKQKFSEA